MAIDKAHPHQPELLSTGQAAKVCSVTPDTILKWIKRGRLRGIRTAGGHYRVHRNDLAPHTAAGPGKDRCSPAAACWPANIPCWEYLSDQGTVREDCRQCVVYRVRAARCFALAGLEAEIGHQRRFCQESCEDCVYYRRVNGLAAHVLLISSDEQLIDRLSGERSEAIDLRVAHTGYEASAVVSAFRPAYAAVDVESLGGTEAGLLDALARDPRVPGLRVILVMPPPIPGRRRRRPKSRLIVGTMEKPFGLDELVEMLGRIPLTPPAMEDAAG